MTGQAAIGVAVSAVEVISAAGSLHGSTSAQALADSEPEEKSAFVFFALSTLFLVASAGAQVILTRLPVYKTLMHQFTQTAEHNHGDEVDDERAPTMAEPKKHQLIRVAKANGVFNFAVAYVFIVTLVSITLDNLSSLFDL